MKVLLTGATASQVPSERDTSSSTFSSLVVEALRKDKHDVTWVKPSVDMTKDYLEEFDSVVVGIAPPNSTAAHRIYGSLSIAKYAQELGTLRLMIDAPEPKRVWDGLRAMHNKPEDLTKPFYSNRYEYRKTSDKKTLVRLHKAIDMLYTKEWPRTIYPSLPWMPAAPVSSKIPMMSESDSIGLNYDSRTISTVTALVPDSEDSDYWIADFPSTQWSQRIGKTLRYQISPAKGSRWERSEDSLSRLQSSIGCLISTHSQGMPWWSPTLAQALRHKVPVVTDWSLSSMLGPEWSVLAQSVEEMSMDERVAMAERQKASYLKAVPSWKSSVQSTCNALLRDQE